jgi:hypothetical protein
MAGVVAPLLHRYRIFPEILSHDIAPSFCPGADSSVTGQVMRGKISSVMMMQSTSWQLAASVTVTQYSPPASTEIEDVVDPLLHR